VSAAVTAKAHRLVSEGRVTLSAAPAAELSVRGDTGTYRVFVSAHGQACNCPATSRCSHIEAALALILGAAS
jgi:hypothetical protein